MIRRLIVLAVAFTAGACSSSSSSNGPTTTTAPPRTTVAATAPPTTAAPELSREAKLAVSDCLDSFGEPEYFVRLAHADAGLEDYRGIAAAVAACDEAVRQASVDSPEIGEKATAVRQVLGKMAIELAGANDVDTMFNLAADLITASSALKLAADL